MRSLAEEAGGTLPDQPHSPADQQFLFKFFCYHPFGKVQSSECPAPHRHSREAKFDVNLPGFRYQLEPLDELLKSQCSSFPICQMGITTQQLLWTMGDDIHKALSQAWPKIYDYSSSHIQSIRGRPIVLHKSPPSGSTPFRAYPPQPLLPHLSGACLKQ